MVKNLTRLGNSSALIIDKTLMDLMEIDADTPLKLSVENRRLIIEPVAEAERQKRFRTALRRVTDKHAKTLKRLGE